jgi:DNA-binding response OmpR family regulator
VAIVESAQVECRHPVLIVEDDRNIATLVATYLKKEGFDTVVAAAGDTGLALARSVHPALVILDVMLPKLDGFAICRELRKSSDVPILMLTARSEEIDRVLGFSLAADDYVVKPFSPRELAERVKAILRRVNGRPARNRERIELGRLSLDPEQHSVTVDGLPTALTAIEFRLLYALMSAPGRVFTRQELLDKWPERGKIVVDRAVDVHIGKLRQKLNDDSSAPSFIRTIRGVGYRFAGHDS